MSKTITLTIGERLATLKLFDAFKGSITEMAVVMDDIKKIAITAEDWEAAGRTVVPNPDGSGETWKWNEADEKTWKEIGLGNESAAFLAKSIKDKSDKGEVTLADGALLSINSKLQ